MCHKLVGMVAALAAPALSLAVALPRKTKDIVTPLFYMLVM
jgi:hypothetical protein